MKHLGFTSLASEWWHYDLGDFLWSRSTGQPWLFESLEPQVSARF
jgi:D-alanyl-D-alanine dipeptidase